MMIKTFGLGVKYLRRTQKCNYPKPTTKGVGSPPTTNRPSGPSSLRPRPIPQMSLVASSLRRSSHAAVFGRGVRRFSVLAGAACGGGEAGKGASSSVKAWLAPASGVVLVSGLGLGLWSSSSHVSYADFAAPPGETIAGAEEVEEPSRRTRYLFGGLWFEIVCADLNWSEVVKYYISVNCDGRIIENRKNASLWIVIVEALKTLWLGKYCAKKSLDLVIEYFGRC